jgi:CRP-like cAMP-binding protein
MLLAALGEDDRLARAGRLLGHAHSGRDRGLVLEALEALLPPSERTRLLPLLEETDPRALAKMAAAALERPLPSFDQAVTEALGSNDALTHDLLRATLPLDALARQAAVDATHAFMPYERREHPVTNVDTMLHLRSLDMFAGLTTRQLAELTRVVEERNYDAGETIVHEDEFDDKMYFIVTGRVRISKGGEDVTALGEGEFFGEIAVLDGEKRSASATAEGPVHLLRLTRQDLFDVMEEHPGIAVAICQTLGRRIRNLLEERGETPAAPGVRRPPGGDGG